MPPLSDDKLADLVEELAAKLEIIKKGEPLTSNILRKRYASMPSRQIHKNWHPNSSAMRELILTSILNDQKAAQLYLHMQDVVSGRARLRGDNAHRRRPPAAGGAAHEGARRAAAAEQYAEWVRRTAVEQQQQAERARRAEQARRRGAAEQQAEWARRNAEWARRAAAAERHRRSGTAEQQAERARRAAAKRAKATREAARMAVGGLPSSATPFERNTFAKFQKLFGPQPSRGVPPGRGRQWT
jgi:hypothetical protein